jgi:hypothetical protein
MRIPTFVLLFLQSRSVFLTNQTRRVRRRAHLRAMLGSKIQIHVAGKGMFFAGGQKVANEGRTLGPSRRQREI